MRPFRFAVNVWGADSRAAWQDKARKLEDLGYAMLSVPDHVGRLLSPMAALLSAAEATRTLRVGTNVLNTDLYHPVLLAREAATVDLLTDGRLQLGLGAGYMASEYAETGLPYSPGTARVQRLAEAVAILKRLFGGGRVTFQGQYFHVAEHELQPRPVQRPHPPILIGGDGRRLLELAATEADVIGLCGLRFRSGGPAADVSGFRAAAVDERLAWLRAAAGDRFGQLELSALVQRVGVVEDRRRAAEAFAAEVAGLDPEDALHSPYLLFGTVDQLVEQLQQQRERWGISSYTVFEPAVDAFAPVVARLAGT